MHMYNSLLLFCIDGVDEQGPCILYLSILTSFFLVVIKTKNQDLNQYSLSNKGSPSCSQVRHYNSLWLNN